MISLPRSFCSLQRDTLLETSYTCPLLSKLMTLILPCVLETAASYLRNSAQNLSSCQSPHWLSWNYIYDYIHSPDFLTVVSTNSSWTMFLGFLTTCYWERATSITYDHRTLRTSSPVRTAVCRDAHSGRPLCVFPFSVTAPLNKLSFIWIYLLPLFVAWTPNWRQDSVLWTPRHADSQRLIKPCCWLCPPLLYLVCGHPAIQATCSPFPTSTLLQHLFCRPG